MSSYTEISLVILNLCYLFRTIYHFKATKLLLQSVFVSRFSLNFLRFLPTTQPKGGVETDRSYWFSTEGNSPICYLLTDTSKVHCCAQNIGENHDSIFLIIEKKPRKHDEVRKSKHLGLSCADLNRLLFFGMIVCKLTTWLVTIFDVYILAEQALKSPIICMWSQTSWNLLRHSLRKGCHNLKWNWAINKKIK